MCKYFRDIHYIEKNRSEQYYTVENVPPNLIKKMKLLDYFKCYMNKHLMKAGANILAKDTDQLSRTPYLYLWYRYASSVVMQLTNGTLQVRYNY